MPPHPACSRQRRSAAETETLKAVSPNSLFLYWLMISGVCDSDGKLTPHPTPHPPSRAGDSGLGRTSALPAWGEEKSEQTPVGQREQREKK